MPSLAYFGIESSGLSLVIDLLILFGVVLYGSLVYWTYADARRRIVDPMLIGCATAASLFPFVGTIIYMILRPPEYLEDVHERELEVRAAEARLHELHFSLCPHCDYPVERDFIRCPSCLRRLKERCVSCARPLDRAWTICPYCETEVPAARPSRSAQRRSRGAMTEAASMAGASLEDELSSSGVESMSAAAPRSRAPQRGAARPAESALETADHSTRTPAVPVRAGEPTPKASERAGSGRRGGRVAEPAVEPLGEDDPADSRSKQSSSTRRRRSTS